MYNVRTLSSNHNFEVIVNVDKLYSQWLIGYEKCTDQHYY